MKSYLLAVLFILVTPNVMLVSAAEYGQPYGSTDETPMEATDVKSISEVNNDIALPENKDEETPIEQENETPMEATDGAVPYGQ